MPRHAKSTKYNRDTEMIEGLRKHRKRLRGSLPPEWLSVDDLIERFQEHLDAMAEASDKEIEWRVALEREAKLEAGIKELMVRVTLLVQSSFGAGAATLREFGVKPFVRRKPSMATLKLAIEKRLATRALRRTMGRRQKRKLKGR